MLTMPPLDLARGDVVVVKAECVQEIDPRTGQPFEARFVVDWVDAVPLDPAQVQWVHGVWLDGDRGAIPVEAVDLAASQLLSGGQS